MLTRRDAIRKTALAGLGVASMRHMQAEGAGTLFGGHKDQRARQAALARQILADADLRQVYAMAQKLLAGGINAGTGYQTTWIRDMNTFIEVALKVNPPKRFRDALLMFCKFQGPQGDIIDCYNVMNKRTTDTRTSPLAPGYIAGKNTVESDQESSLVQAVRKYIDATRDASILEERVGDRTVRKRLAQAMEYVMTNRFDAAHGLVWGGATIDWGDVQPEGLRGVVLDKNSHRAISIYANAMLLVAINDYVKLPGMDAKTETHWKSVGGELHQNIRKYLWDEKNQKFIPHLYLNGSPFPPDFDENAINYHGGTTVAIEAGVLSREEVAHALARMEEDVRKAQASSIGLTIYPPYPLGYYKNPQLTVPYTYQNGGDWTWFGGRTIQQLVRYGYVAEAYRNVRPMVERVKLNGDFHEWWTRDNQPRGSAQFRGSAGVLGRAIEMLQGWANGQLPA